MVARWAHNPKVVRSSRASATKERLFQKEAAFFVAQKCGFYLSKHPLCLLFTFYTARFTIRYTLGLVLILKKDFLRTIIPGIKVGQTHFNPGR